jgi:hypothetical protein
MIKEYEGFRKIRCYKCRVSEEMFGKRSELEICDTCNDKGFLYQQNESESEILEEAHDIAPIKKTRKRRSFRDRIDAAS